MCLLSKFNAFIYSFYFPSSTTILGKIFSGFGHFRKFSKLTYSCASKIGGHYFTSDISSNSTSCLQFCTARGTLKIIQRLKTLRQMWGTTPFFTAKLGSNKTHEFFVEF